MEKEFYIIMGRSGSGKGTQADLLKKSLEEKGMEKVLHITTGSGFRSFVQSDSHAASLAREINDTGALQPEFLAIWNWANSFITSLSGNETVILDGAPRRVDEVGPLHSAISFFGYTKLTVLYLDVSETWAMDKLTSRGREDDTLREEQERKMKWFNEDMLPCIDMYSRDPRYTYIHINGEQTIENVHAEIISKLSQ